MTYDVVTVGSATRDVYVVGLSYDKHKDKHFRTGKAVCLPFGSKVYMPEVFYTTGGAGINAAVTFGRQGFRTAPLISIGDDGEGGEVIKVLKVEKLMTSLVQRQKGVDTGYSIILLTKSGERTILAHSGASEKLNLRRVSWGRIKTKCVYLNSLHKDTALLRGAITIKKKCGALIAWNPGGTDLKMGFKKIKKYLKNLDIFIANQEEMSALFRVPYKMTGRIFKAADRAIGGIVVMTRGPSGVMVSDGTTLWRAGVFHEKKIVDRTGAGDSFGSGFTAAYLRTKDISEAIRFASANATSKVEHLGAHGGLLYKRDISARRWNIFNIEREKLT